MLRIPRNVFIFLFLFAGSCLLCSCKEKQEVLLWEEESETAVQETIPAATEAVSEPAAPQEIRVYVCGAVAVPGVVTLAPTARVCDALDKAGGLTAEAEPRAVNQAAFLEDGMQIVVPTKAEAEVGGMIGEALADPGGDGSSSSGGKVNLNRASAAELKTLTGIGDAKAADIIRYREEHGGFQSIEEIKQINGIKDAVFDKIKDQIVVG